MKKLEKMKSGAIQMFLLTDRDETTAEDETGSKSNVPM